MTEHQRDVLETDIIRNGCRVLDRSTLNEAQAKLALQHSGAVDEETSIQLGRIIGATHIMTGYFRLVTGGNKDLLSYSLRLIDLKSSRILGTITDDNLQ
jgi:hypothetical protein